MLPVSPSGWYLFAWSHLDWTTLPSFKYDIVCKLNMKPKGGKIASDKTHQIFCQIVPCNKQATLQNLTAKCIICAGYSPFSTLRATMAECLMSDASSRTICMSQTWYVVDVKKIESCESVEEKISQWQLLHMPGVWSSIWRYNDVAEMGEIATISTVFPPP